MLDDIRKEHEDQIKVGLLLVNLGLASKEHVFPKGLRHYPELLPGKTQEVQGVRTLQTTLKLAQDTITKEVGSVARLIGSFFELPKAFAQEKNSCTSGALKSGNRELTDSEKILMNIENESNLIQDLLHDVVRDGSFEKQYHEPFCQDEEVAIQKCFRESKKGNVYDKEEIVKCAPIVDAFRKCVDARMDDVTSEKSSDAS